MTDNVPTSSNPSESAAALRRQQFWAKVIVIIVIVAVAILKPKVEAWLDKQAGNQTDIVQTDRTATNSPDSAGSSAGAGLDDLGTLTINDPDDVPADMPADPEVTVPAPDKKPNASSNSSSKSRSEANNSDKTSSSKTASKNTTSTSKKSTPASGSAVASSEKPTSSNTKSSGKSVPRTDVAKTDPQPRSDTKPGTSGKATGQPEEMNPDKPSLSGTKSSGAKTTDTKTGKSKTAGPKLATPEASTESVPGKLTLIKGSRDVFVSTAGLKYVSGSQDGHRLKHVLKHAEDNLEKPVHGVYSGDRDQILAWIDIAYAKGQKGGKGTRTEDEGGRTVYTVDLGEKIGYVGGQVGKRRNNPPCRFLRLVVQNGNEVVTAFPAESM